MPMHPFVEACIDSNSVAELIDALIGEADTGDMDQWRITADDWRRCVGSALAHKIASAQMGAIPQGPWHHTSDNHRRYVEACALERIADGFDPSNR